MIVKAPFKRRLGITVGIAEICPFDNVPMHVSGCGNPRPGALVKISDKEYTCSYCGHTKYVQTVHIPPRIKTPLS